MNATLKTFEMWFAAVNAAVEVRYGLSVEDLPDCDYRTWWDDGMTPRAAAIRAIKNARE